MSLTETEINALTTRVLSASDVTIPIAPITDERADFDHHDAYRVAARIMARQIARGEQPIGWKIGFTNRTIWDEYGVYAPIWAPIYTGTVLGTNQPDTPIACCLGRFLEPRIEPEIVFRLAAPPHPDMDKRDLLDCIEAVAHGFETVHLLYPGWRFKAADTIAAFGLHGCLCHGPFIPVASEPDPSHWAIMLSSFVITVSCNGIVIDEGIAANVLGGPVSALRHFVRGLAEHPLGRGLRSGDLVTTGTITRAFPVMPDELWVTSVSGLPVPGLSIVFS